MSKWQKVADVGIPKEWGEYFCWAPGYDKPVILESWGNNETPSFGNGGGAWPEITHFMPITLPDNPMEF